MPSPCCCSAAAVWLPSTAALDRRMETRRKGERGTRSNLGDVLCWYKSGDGARSPCFVSPRTEMANGRTAGWHRLAGRAGVVGALLAASLAVAAPPPITNSNYTLQLYEGTLTGAARVIGFGGAYTALA